MDKSIFANLLTIVFPIHQNILSTNISLHNQTINICMYFSFLGSCMRKFSQNQTTHYLISGVTGLL